jgi:hypothetical protein
MNPFKHPIKSIKNIGRRRKNGEPKVPEQTTPAPPVPGPPPAPKVDLPKELVWLFDAPLFIDEKQVNAFYDAVLRPDYEGTSFTLSNSLTKGTTFGGQAGAGITLPLLINVNAGGSVERANQAESDAGATYEPVSNPYRNLLALAIHYASYPDLQKRLVLANLGAQDKTTDGAGEHIGNSWLGAEFIQQLPRGLVFIDIPKGGKFLPAALELANGEVCVLADELRVQLSKKAEKYAKNYPGSDADEKDKDEYFEFFDKNWDDRIALVLLETAMKQSRSEWVDFNIAAKTPGEIGRYLHLHMAGRGQYESGTFGYNLITRGFNYGVRIVGTLKSGPDLNVLAIFES